MKRPAAKNPVRANEQTKCARLFRSLAFRMSLALLLCLSLTFTGCFLTNEAEPYYGRVAVPGSQEFRWSDGGLPQTFDPALAAAPPDTDAVRALFEGLTDYDPQTLQAVPGVATRWEASDDKREWTFYLRNDARWSNGDQVTANDFVRSWQRTLKLGSRAPHARLMENIVGAVPPFVTVKSDALPEAAPASSPATVTAEKTEAPPEPNDSVPTPAPELGVEAIGDLTLKVKLQQPDESFPSLVAHPIFRPIHNAREESDGSALLQPVVSNGPFKLTQVAGDGVILERAVSYWDAQTVNLNRVRFVATTNAEDALERYRAGDVDAVTNAGFQPLALKLLAPYKDFRRGTFGALTYYKFNTNNPPFDDVRVREALTIAIDRERISEDGMDGASEPATTFLPTQKNGDRVVRSETPRAVTLDVSRARTLLAEAGFPNGARFPRIRLLVNRNDQQRQIAQSIARMWRDALGVESEIIVHNWDEYEAALRDGEYDVARRGMVMQTMDEAANMRAMFEPDLAPAAVESGSQPATNDSPRPPGAQKDDGAEKSAPVVVLAQPIATESQALKQLPAMPIYFASSYALVKPYMIGFESNLLDAPSLKRVRIDTSWQAPQKK